MPSQRQYVQHSASIFQADAEQLSKLGRSSGSRLHAGCMALKQGIDTFTDLRSVSTCMGKGFRVVKLSSEAENNSPSSADVAKIDLAGVGLAG